MRSYVDLGRSFRDLTDSELDSPETLASLNEYAHSRVGWPTLLKERRVILLAEAGSGKTWEMEEQARLLGEAGFFVPLEILDRTSLSEALLGDARKLKAWLDDGASEAWFFLDARDELLLTEGKLDRALRRFADSIDGHLARARVIVSSRPLDWRPQVDTATVAAILPVPSKLEPATPADDAFIQALRRERGASNATPNSATEDKPKGDIRTVVLLPLSERQIRHFAESSGVPEPAAFMTEIARQDAWTFARRPLDLTELIAAWVSTGSLGTRVQQHEANIRTKLKDGPERPDRGVLSDESAIEGAERLALALALTRTRTLRSPDQTLDAARADGVLDPAAILTDWSPAERQALLRRALFDPATYGRIRFHHRSVQEYLAARHLRRLRQAGMSTKAVFRLLFGERYQTKVVLPSMQPITAWLSLWDEPVRRELIAREPETLLSLGDPESLDYATRAAVLRAFSTMYHEGSWRGLNIAHDSVRRLADPSLSSTVRELWDSDPTSPDVLELLGEIIWKGKLAACGDIAEQIARDSTADYYRRVVAVRALLDCGLDATARGIVESILADPTNWQDQAVFALAPDLYPRVLSVAELILLIQRTPEPRSTTSGFGWVLREICSLIAPTSPDAGSLREALSALIWDRRGGTQEIYHLRSGADYLAPALLTLCRRQLDAGVCDPELIHDVIVATRFGKHDRTDDKELAEIRLHFTDKPCFRPIVFWAELALADEVAPDKDHWVRLHNVEQYGLVGSPTEGDTDWLLEAARTTADGERRPVALFALLHIWVRAGRQPEGLDELRSAVADAPALLAIVGDWARPPATDPRHLRWERQSKKRQCVSQAREEQRLGRWKIWRTELLAAPEAAFETEKKALTLNNIYYWLQASNGQINRYNVWDKARLAEAFGIDIARRTAEALQAEWRGGSLALWSEKPAGERNSTTHRSIIELCGLASEAEIPGWASKLTPDEARLATRYSTLELNGFAPFILDLVRTHPKEVEEVLGGEIAAELSVAEDYVHLPLLQDVSYAHHDIQRLLAPRLLKILFELPMQLSASAENNWAVHLDRMFHVLDQIAQADDRRLIGAECARRFEADPEGAQALTWLRGIFRFDPERGAQVLVAGLATSDARTQERALHTFAVLFGDRHGLGNDAVTPPIQARSLGQLIRAAYKFVRVEDDNVHDGVYSPDLRDKAEAGRSFLLSRLLDTPGQEACQVLLELADEPEFAHFPDRLRLLARQRAALDAEFAPFDTAGMAALETRYEAPPRDRDGLFQVMMDRLGDLAHDVAHHEFTDRATLRTICDEVEMQRTLALRLSAKANGAFDVTREPETADLKKTDIRLAAVAADQQAAIEIKLIDKRWSLSDLEHALRHQLVGQYLRHDRCKAGCLLLAYDGSKSYWVHPIRSERMSLHAMQAYLDGIARTLEIENEGQIRLAVVVLDLTDPSLVPAHR